MDARTQDELRLAADVGTYSLEAVANLFVCSQQHVTNMVKAGLVPGSFRFGKLLRFHKGVVNAWLAKQGGVAA